MAVLYSYNVYQDMYSLMNINVNPITYTLFRVECNTVTEIESKTIAPKSSIYLPLTFTDGKYQFDITDGINTVHKYDILYYNNLLLDIIDGVEESICPCVCKDCDECKEVDDYKKSFSTLISTISLAALNPIKYTDTIKVAMESLKCNLDEALTYFTYEKMINGKDEVEELNLKILAIHYLAYYYIELFGAENAEEINYVNNKFKALKILKCIKKLGINTVEIADIISRNVEVAYWQLDNTSDNINDVIIDMGSINFLVDKPTHPFLSFEQGVLINYTRMGRIAFAIKGTSIEHIEIIDSLGNDVTNDYNTHYFEGTNILLYVSKAVISFSTPYFKFKKLVNL